MYALIQLREAPKLSVVIVAPPWDTVSSPTVTGDARSARTADIFRFVGQWAPAKSATFRNDLLEDLGQLADWVPQPDWPIAMDMWLAYAHLEPELQNARKATIDRLIAAEIPFVPPSKAALMKRIRHGALLIPDAFMEAELRFWCYQLRMLILRDVPGIKAPEDRARFELLMQITQRCQNPDGTRTSLGTALINMATTRPLRDLHGLIAITPRLIHDGCKGLVAAAELAIQSPEHLHLSTILIEDARFEMMSAAPASDTETNWDAFVAPYSAKADALYASNNARVYWATQEALDQGVPMGASRAQSLASLHTWHSMVESISQGMQNESIKLSQGGHSAPTPTTSDGIADIEPVWSWSVHRLAQWIGPVAETTHNAVDRKKIVADEIKIHEAQPLSHDQKPAKTMTADDVGEIIHKGLCATAQFFADELRDLLPLAKQLGVAQTLIDKVRQSYEPLLTLANSNKAVDEVHARNLLQDAEIHIQSLRGELDSAQSSATVQSRFPFEFDKALRKESITLGKRHGGIIQCPVTAQDWSYVVANFHRRWLPTLKSIEVKGSTWPLSSDQALGLYVTASSQSAYAFDVSVHLWRRRHGKSSLPSLEDGSLPPMNTEDWFDTYVPCCVLHVPAHKK